MNEGLFASSFETLVAFPFRAFYLYAQCDISIGPHILCLVLCKGETLLFFGIEMMVQLVSVFHRNRMHDKWHNGINIFVKEYYVLPKQMPFNNFSVTSTLNTRYTFLPSIRHRVPCKKNHKQITLSAVDDTGF